MDKESILRQYFGHEHFRVGQEALINATMTHRDVLGIMPTGGGKSICYQIPALLFPGITVVISPLISLMKDQVSALKVAGIPAGYINSTLTSEQVHTVYRRAHEGKYKLLYVAPERLDTGSFISLAQHVQISMIAVDEAHCVSQWGQDFRPSYLKIAAFITSLPQRPVVSAFTATATEEVRQDIIHLLGLEEPFCTVTGFDRPNLFFDVKTPHDKLSELLSLLKARPGKSGIVYCATRANVERICDTLCQKGIKATRYHAGLEDEERRKNQEDFQFDRKPVMVATNAFGMGIDKSNVSFVIHYNMPKSMEAYYQEAGRAGRDGAAADCILLFSESDVVTAKFLIESSGNEELDEEQQALLRLRDLDRLRSMAGYCKTSDCLRGYILSYFGQTHEPACGHCGNCTSEYQEVDITTPAQMILSCLHRVKAHLGYFVGKSLIIQVLRGSNTQRIVKLRLNTVSTYGLMRDSSPAQISGQIDALLQLGYIRANPLHSTLEPTDEAAAILFDGKQVSMSIRKDKLSKPEPKEKKQKGKVALQPQSINDELFDTLKATRTRLAQEESVPAYIVFSNAVLLDMAAKRPHTMEEFLSISGVGEVKAAKYGLQFLDAIVQYEKERKL